MADFPRGWILANKFNNQVNPGITLPATPNVLHVIDVVEAKILSTDAAGGILVDIAVSSSDNIYNNAIIGELGVSIAPANNVTVDSLTITDANLHAGPGASIVVFFFATLPASVNLILRLQGHDI